MNTYLTEFIQNRGLIEGNDLLTTSKSQDKKFAYFTDVELLDINHEEESGESVVGIEVNDSLFKLVNKIAKLPGFRAMYHKGQHGVQLLAGKSNLKTLTRKWFVDHLRQLDELGCNLGAGFTGDWSLEFLDGRVWSFSDPEALIVVADTEVHADIFEENCRAILEERE